MNLLRRTDPNKFSLPSVQIPKVLCRRCKKPVDSVQICANPLLPPVHLEVRCHNQTRIVAVYTLNPSSNSYIPILEAFEPASERGKDVRKRLSARRNGWRVTP